MHSTLIPGKHKGSVIPNEIRSLPQWVPWRYGKFREDGSREKVPIDPRTGKQGDCTDPDMWRSFPDAAAYAAEHFADGEGGVGFVFTEDDPYCGVDIDDGGDRATGYVHPAVREVLDRLDTYAEWSPLGKGIKAIGRATKPGGRCKTQDTPWGGKFEMYDRRQFFTVTGDVIRDAPVRDAQSAVDAMYGRFLIQPLPARGEGLRRANRAVSGRATALTDGEVEEKASNHPKTGGMFRKLRDHDDASGYSSRSEADLAFCGMLAYWTGCDAEQMKRIFRDSARARGKYADKGEHAESYLSTTVNKAIEGCRITYDPGYGERKKAEVRETVAHHRDALAGSDLKGSKRAVMDHLLGVASVCGMDRNGAVEFNANQEETAERVGVSQKQVSNVIKALIGEGRLTRKTKGKKGRNSVYQLAAITNTSTTYADTSITYVHRGPNITPPVFIRSRSRDHQQSPTASAKTGPEIVAEFAEADDHTLGCTCALCSVQAPSYASFARERVA